MNAPWFALVESNTTGTGKDFAEAARRRGMRPILLTRSPQRYRYVDELDLDVCKVDTTQPDVVEAACRALLPAGLCGMTSSSEYFVATAAVVAIRLGLPAPDPLAIGRCRDKGTQRRWLREQGVLVPDFAVCSTSAEAVAAAASLAAPVVVKPLRGSGSEGVRACGDPATAGEWARRLLTRDEEVLVEREIRGPEYSVEILDDEVVGVTGKHVGPAPFFVETGHDFPVDAGRVTSMLAAAASAAVRRIGLTSGPAHVELRVGPDGRPYLIEINPRLAGGLIPRLVRYSCGRDLVDEVVALAAGRAVTPEIVVPGRFASIRFVVPDRPGTVRGVTGLDRARSMPGVVEAECGLAAGAEIGIEHSFADRKGHVIGVGETAARAVDITERAIVEIGVEYAPDVIAREPSAVL